MKINYIFFIVIAIAVFLRFYNLSNVPPSASLDEATIGYNAYSILKTGADEYGTKFPILLRAYDDWRPALYVYLVIPFIKLLGLNVVSVRLPSVILSVFTVIATYFLVKELFRENSKFEIRNSKQTQNSNVQNSKFLLGIGSAKLAEEIPIIATAMLVISPWHIYISRLGHEANAGLSFLILGILCFFKAKNFNTAPYYSKKIDWFFLLSIIFFVFSFMSYQAEKIVVPILLASIFFIFRDKILERKKELLLGFLISLIFLIPFVKATFSPSALIRFNATNILSSNYERFQKEAILLERSVKDNNILGKIIHNRKTVAVQILTEGYMSHFNPKWLFANTGDERHKVPNLGLFYIWEEPLILLGLVFLIRSKFNNKIKAFILFWIFISPLPSAIATDAPHAMRSYSMLPMPQILVAIGLIMIISKIKDKISNTQIKYLIFYLCFLFFIFNFLFFFNNYFFVFPKTQSSSFQYALAKTIPYVLENEKSYSKVIFSNTDNFYQSYMFFLFYTKYDPYLYQQEGGTRSGGFAETHKFGKYEFRPIVWSKEKKIKNTLYIGNPNDFGEEKAIFSGYYLNGNIGTKVINIK